MLLKYFYDESLAQASYLVGCAKTGEALVIDPARDIEPYLRTADRHGLRITHITETHIHADFVSGLRELAARTGATAYVSDCGDAAWKYAFADMPGMVTVRDGDSWMVGNIKVQVLHTPGHTPEHISFMITDTAASREPIGVFTGDFIFAGDVGRPDLLEEAAGIAGTKEPGARRMFESIRKFKQLPDYLQLWPGHGAGSACGKALGAIPSTTLGYEKRVNPAFAFEQEQAFVDWLLAGQPEPPGYFAQMKRVNKHGPALLATLGRPAEISRAQLDAAIADGAQVFDLRDRKDFAEAHVPGSINVPVSSPTFSTFIGWFVRFDAPVHLILAARADAPGVMQALRAIGVDDVRSVGGPELVAHGKSDRLPVLGSAELAGLMSTSEPDIIDVRGADEYALGHIAGARRIHFGMLPRLAHTLPKHKQIVLACASGYRAQVAASVLRKGGTRNVVALADASDVWSRRLPTASGI